MFATIWSIEMPSCRLELPVVGSGSMPVMNAPAGFAWAPEAPERDRAPVLSRPLSTSKWSRNGSSAFSVGVNSNPVPSVVGVQRSMTMLFGTYTVQNRVTGAAAARASAVEAGSIRSSSGSASVAPTPRSTVRREIACLEIIMTPTSASGTAGS